MRKKISIIIFTLVLSLIILTCIFLFTDFGTEVRKFIFYKILTPQETVVIKNQEKIKITYTYNWSEESFDIDVTDKELIKMIQDNISNKPLDNYSGQIGLAVIGEYSVDLGNDIRFKFDYYYDDGFVMFYKNDEHFLTKINPEILSKIIDIVDIRLTENIKMFQTSKITIEHKEDKKINIERKTEIEYILSQCKNIYIKELDYEPMIISPDYTIDFNNQIKIFKYNKNDKGFLLKNDVLYEAYGLELLETFLENAFNNLEQKEKMFNTNSITIISPDKSINIVDKNIIEKITTPIIYSFIKQTDWTKNYDITEEYNNGIKIKMNNYEFLIPGKIGTVTIGNRYIISENKEISLCFPLQDIEKYVNELLGNKIEETTGLVSIQVP